MGQDVFLESLDLMIEHTSDNDLFIYLISPNGDIRTLSEGRGGEIDNYGDPSDTSCLAVTRFVTPFDSTYCEAQLLVDDDLKLDKVIFESSR